jgi:hypothetical protein
VICAAAPASAACKPVAVVEGPRAIAEPTAAILRAHGVGSDASRCQGAPVVHASLAPTPTPSEYSLQIRDTFGRANERRVRDAETAATLIETWTTDEDADLFGPRADAVTTGAPAEAATAALAAPAWRLGAALESTWGTDGSHWYGASATGCRTVGALCLGARLRLTHDNGNTGPADDLDQLQTTTEALVVAESPRSLGRVTLVPLAGLGASWTHVTPQTGTYTAPASRFALRLEGAFAAQIALSPAWSLTGEIGATVDRPSSDAVSTSGFSLPGPAMLFRATAGIGYTP